MQQCASAVAFDGKSADMVGRYFEGCMGWIRESLLRDVDVSAATSDAALVPPGEHALRPVQLMHRMMNVVDERYRVHEGGKAAFAPSTSHYFVVNIKIPVVKTLLEDMLGSLSGRLQSPHALLYRLNFFHLTLCRCHGLEDSRTHGVIRLSSADQLLQLWEAVPSGSESCREVFLGWLRVAACGLEMTEPVTHEQLKRLPVLEEFVKDLFSGIFGCMGEADLAELGLAGFECAQVRCHARYFLPALFFTQVVASFRRW